MIKIYYFAYFAITLLSLSALLSHCNQQPSLLCDEPSPTLSLIAIILGLVLIVVTLLVMGICVLNLIVVVRNKMKGKELIFI